MKSIVLYYSYGGHTKKVADTLAGFLGQKGTVETVRLEPLDESGNFFAQCGRAHTHTRATLGEINLDLGQYDLICFGTPLWAFAPAPALNTCLDKCSGIEGKRIILFTTFGSGTGNKRCLQYMQGVLANRGVKEIQEFSVQGLKAENKEFVLSQIMRLWPNG